VREIIIFGHYAPYEGKVQESENFYNQLQKILNRTSKNDYILFSGDLHGRVGNAEFHTFVGSFGEPVRNTS
jgi:hypothetical protein